ncbi:hydroxysqualene dehydroxylase HpnE [Rhodoferax sp.]|uniref:hydroxysqualene dehydroxylase HpnE n=1 Tax=Rhodoferax sp. TaxID=50421 RepID=UPI0025F78AFD|nr:hydroxysqualene dehydroxylase HpnE [Rhodoferax sp.]
MKIAVIGAGWAGLAAAVTATQAGHHATVFEASRAVGGRARAIFGTELDNGQHILIGAYTDTLRLMREVGVDVDQALLRLPLTLLFPDGQGLRLPSLPAPFDAFVGILQARGWGWRDKVSLLRTAVGWQLARFQCRPQQSVADLCATLTARVVDELIEPLCVAALNTPANRSSGQVFLRVIQDSLFGAPGGSNLLLPKVDLSALFPTPAVRWLESRGATVTLGHRVFSLQPQGAQWQVDGAVFDQVLLACPPWEATRLVESSGVPADAWLAQAHALQFESIATVYATSDTRLSQPMLSLKAGPAQFVFDRGQLGGTAGLLAFVASASQGDRQTLEEPVIAQGRAQLALPDLQALRTVVEKRATFACTPGLQRPSQHIAPGLTACGDYVDGPYPATLEGAVRSGMAGTLSIQ